MQKQRCNLYENNCLDALANIVLRVQGTWNKSNRVDNYKSLLKEVRKQFDTPAHPFNILQKEFEDYVVERYSEFIKEDFVSVKEVLVKDISDVIKTLCFVLIKFYQMKLPLTERNADLFLTPMTDLIVKGALRNIVMRVLWVEHENSVVALQKQLAGFQGVKLDKLKVGKFFCFDKSFREQFKRRVGTKPSNRTVLEKSIEAFAKIREINSPNLKLKQLLKVTKKIIKEIDEFWEAYEVKREKLIMDPDSLLSLLIYVIVKSQYSEIYIDHKFLELFITEADKGSTKGYYLVTLGVALDWILEQNPSSFSSVLYLTIIVQGDINLRRSLLTTGQRRSQKTIFVKNKAEPLIQNLAVVEEQKIEEVLESSSREGSELFHTIVTGAELMVDKEISNAFDEFEGVHKKIRRGSQAEEIKGRVPRPTIRDKQIPKTN
eukprot:TRINITY_DN2735_c0_g1_i1.p2 TRINITY_DN2735_c0_g1~~TRINITY_DN2735_c0_g1_i1.p2  ORF type:complete len:433 (+),score=54.44 TRINITY_DN2735_c0_g1_i1:3857-5155(+)